MIPDDDEEQRVTRIARALCRLARIDPDAAVDEHTCPLLPAAHRADAEMRSAWIAFRASARAFAARHPREIVSNL